MHQTRTARQHQSRHQAGPGAPGDRQMSCRRQCCCWCHILISPTSSLSTHPAVCRACHNPFFPLGCSTEGWRLAPTPPSPPRQKPASLSFLVLPYYQRRQADAGPRLAQALAHVARAVRTPATGGSSTLLSPPPSVMSSPPTTFHLQPEGRPSGGLLARRGMASTRQPTAGSSLCHSAQLQMRPLAWPARSHLASGPSAPRALGQLPLVSSKLSTQSRPLSRYEGVWLGRGSEATTPLTNARSTCAPPAQARPPRARCSLGQPLPAGSQRAGYLPHATAGNDSCLVPEGGAAHCEAGGLQPLPPADRPARQRRPRPHVLLCRR